MFTDKDIAETLKTFQAVIDSWRENLIISGKYGFAFNLGFSWNFEDKKNVIPHGLKDFMTAYGSVCCTGHISHKGLQCSLTPSRSAISIVLCSDFDKQVSVALRSNGSDLAPWWGKHSKTVVASKSMRINKLASSKHVLIVHIKDRITTFDLTRPDKWIYMLHTATFNRPEAITPDNIHAAFDSMGKSMRAEIERVLEDSNTRAKLRPYYAEVLRNELSW